MNDKRYRKNVGLIVLTEKNQLLICKEQELVLSYEDAKRGLEKLDIDSQ